MKQNSFGKRCIAVFVLLMLLFSVGAVQVGRLTADSDLSEAAAAQDSVKLTLGSCRGTIVDCKGRPLTDTAYERRCILLPGEEGLAAASRTKDDLLRETATEELLAGRPTTLPLAEDDLLPAGGVEYYRPVRYATKSACHILGYIDGEGHGVSGIEKGMDDVLYSGEDTVALIQKTATGKILSAGEVTVKEGKRGKTVQLTVDRDLQKATESAMAEAEKGAAVVMEAATGRIRALVSKPDYCGEYASLVLSDTDAPLLNRALSLYNVGSVFKLLIATALAEEGTDLSPVTCTGSLTVGNRLFHCHQENGHGTVGLKEAMAESCNCFFYTKTMALGAEPILDLSRRCGFHQPVTVPHYAVTASGRLPTLPLTGGALCNLAIGQGDLMLTPLHLAQLYATAVNGGWYRTPVLVEEDSLGPLHEVTVSTTASTMRENLIYALSHGTGLRAQPTASLTAGGKTATAQTGWVKEGKPVLNGWYCGFVETEKTGYVICVVREEVSSGATDCAPLFARIADGIGKYE